MNYLAIKYFPPLDYACSEAINTLCTNLSFSGENIRRVMVTSCHAGEGKSFLSMNILRTMARFGKTVALVDADLRRSTIVSSYGVRFHDQQNPLGLSHYLAGMTEMDHVIYGTDIPGALMVPVGREVTNPLPLLNSQRLGSLVDHLAGRADYVIVDAPPVGAVIDAAQIAKICDGTLLAVSYNAVRRQELIDAKEQLEQTGCPILGVALNMVEMDKYLNKKYYYKSHHYDDQYYRKRAVSSKHLRGRGKTP